MVYDDYIKQIENDFSNWLCENKADIENIFRKSIYNLLKDNFGENTSLQISFLRTGIITNDNIYRLDILENNKYIFNGRYSYIEDLLLIEFLNDYIDQPKDKYLVKPKELDDFKILCLEIFSSTIIKIITSNILKDKLIFENNMQVSFGEYMGKSVKLGEQNNEILQNT